MDTRLYRRGEELRPSAPGVWIYTFVLFGLTIVVVLARVSARVCYKNFGLDDVLIILALISTIIYVAVFRALTVELEPPDFKFVETRQYCMDMVYSVNYAFGMAFTKVSALLFLRRLGLNAFGRISDWIIWTDIGWTLVGATQLSLFQIFACRPLSAISTCWKDATPGTCIDYKPSVLAYSIMLLLGMIPIIVLPILLIKRLQMRTSKKVLMYTVPFLAVIDTVITFLRMLRYMERVWPGISLKLSSNYFYGYDSALTAVEVFLALTTASLPMLYRPGTSLFRRLKTACVPRSLHSGRALGRNSGEAAAASDFGPDSAGRGSSSRRPVQRADAGILSAPRRVKAELYQLTTLHHDDEVTSSTEQVLRSTGSPVREREL